MFEDGAFSHKIDYITIFKDIPHLEGDQNRITGSKVTAFLLNGWILPLGEASAVKSLRLQPVQHAFFDKCTFKYRLTVQALNDADITV